MQVGCLAPVQVPDAPALRITPTVSLEFWARRQRVGTDVVVEKGGDWLVGDPHYSVSFTELHDGGLLFLFQGGWRFTPLAFDKDWHHYAVIASDGATNPTFYVNGIERRVEHSEGSETVTLYPSTRPLHIGGLVGDPRRPPLYSRNLIDELAIYNRALSAKEVAAIYAAGPAGKSPGPIEGLIDLGTSGTSHYWYDPTEKDYPTARAVAPVPGRKLVSITTAEENAFLVAALTRLVPRDKLPAGAYIGLFNDGPGTPWRWESSESFDYANWRQAGEAEAFPEPTRDSLGQDERGVVMYVSYPAAPPIPPGRWADVWGTARADSWPSIYEVANPASIPVVVDTQPTGKPFLLSWSANIGPSGTGEPGNPPITAGYHDIGLKLIRTHDYQGPLDMKTMFPNQNADPVLASSYDFRASDEAWRAIITNGFYPCFRLSNPYATQAPYAPEEPTQ